MEEWHSNGHFNRNGAWAFYVLMTSLSIYFNLCLIIAVFRLKEKKTSTDVLIAGFSSGIVVAALGCGPQCLLNMIKQDFAYGDIACNLEAFFHIVGMVAQFLHVAAIAYRTYVGVVKLEEFQTSKAYACVVMIWSIAVAGTLLFGSFSPIYLVASGTFCFYQWTSIALIAWAWPVAGTAAALMGYWYFQTFKMVAEVRKGARDILLDGSRKNATLVMKLSSLVLFFVFGYSGIVAQSLYEVTVGRAKIWGDVIAASIVLIYWVAAPFAYASVNHRLGALSALTSRPHSGSKFRNKDTPPISLGSGKHSSKHSRHLSSGAVELEGMDKREIPGFSASMLRDTAVTEPNSVRGTNRLEGSPDASQGGVFSFDDVIQRPSAATVTETPDFIADSRAPSNSNTLLIQNQPDSQISPSRNPEFFPLEQNADVDADLSPHSRQIFNPFVAHPEESAHPIQELQTPESPDSPPTVTTPIPPETES